MDLHGPTPVPSPDGYRYLADFVDHASGFWVIVPLEKKSDAFAALQAFKAYAERQTGYKLRCIRDDKGGEWMSNLQKQWVIDNGFKVEHTMRAEPHMLGMAELLNIAHICCFHLYLFTLIVFP